MSTSTTLTHGRIRHPDGYWLILRSYPTKRDFDRVQRLKDEPPKD